MMQPNTKRVLDAGAGDSWFFPASYKSRFGITLIGVDVEEELRLNETLDVRLAADVCKSLPVEPQSVDLVTVYSGIEHFPDNAAFLRNCASALRPGGRIVAQFPGRYATFALINLHIPRRLARMLLRNLMPGSDNILGFQPHYDRTNYSAFCRIAKEAGLEVEFHYPAYFHIYFAFLLPLYILSYFGGLIKFAVGWRDLATYNVFVLRKPGDFDEVLFGPRHERPIRP